MAVKIRLTRRGRKKKALYDVIVADARSPRDGRLIEKLGTYNPLTNPATIVLNKEKALDWLLKGAQPTDTARRILSHEGIMFKKHLQIGVLKEAITQEQADKKFDEWKSGKEASITTEVDSIAKKKADAAKARFDAEKKINEAKAEALRKKMIVEEPVAEVAETEEAAPAEASEPVAEKEEAPAKEETPAEEPKTEEVKAEEAPAEEPKAEETKVEETPVKEPKVEEVKAEEVSAEEPKAEKTKAEEAPVKVTEEPVAEKEKAPAEEKKEEDKK